MEMVGTSWPFALPAQAVATDEALMRRAASGDMAAFDEVWRRHARRLRFVAHSVLRCDSDVDEVLHEAWNIAWQCSSSYVGARGTVSRWLRTLVRNKSIDRLRAVRRRLALAPRYAQWLATDSPAEASGYDRLVSGENAHRLAAALAQLPSLQAHALRCVYFEGLSHPEASALLGMPMGTLKAYIRRGLVKLRASLGSSLPAGLGLEPAHRHRVSDQL